ncbi:MAG: MarR family transcriptional regulator [Bacteroidales bacterium]|jgi:DNA-binding MarR family transcriptional regulator|nr:MarR family transcriptional regulator [Bacteroidales bacterium]
MIENIWGMESPDNSTAYLIVRLSNAHQRRINNDLSAVGLTFSQFVLLSGIHWLEYMKQETTQVALGEVVKFDKSTVSSVLKTLVGKELVTRKEHPVDTRAKILGLTPDGLTLLKQAIPIVNNADRELYENKGIDLTLLNDMLTKLL